MPSIPFFTKKKEESASEPTSQPTTNGTVAPAAAATEPADAPAPALAPAAEPAEASEGSTTHAVTTEKTVIEPKRGFFSRKRSGDGGANASESESESSPSHSRIPSFFTRKKANAPSTVKEEDKENVVPEAEAAPAAPAEDAPTTAETAAAAEKKDDKPEEKVRRRISLFQRRNRADGAVSEGEVTEGEKENAAKAKRTSFWKGTAIEKKEEPAEPAPEDPRLTEAKGKVTATTEAEAAAKTALEAARKALKDAKAALKTVEAEIAAEFKKAKSAKPEEKKEESPVAPATDGTSAAPQVAVEPPVLPTVAAAA